MSPGISQAGFSHKPQTKDVTNWNRNAALNTPEAIDEMLSRISHARTGSFLTVIRMFGNITSPGILSFPKSGATLVPDFPNKGASTFQLLDELDAITRQVGGAVYPAKDSRTSAESFQAYYPQWRRLIPFIDTCLSSGFWRRVSVDVE